MDGRSVVKMCLRQRREDNVEVDDFTQLSIKFTNFRQRITPPVI
jgi:hypothetical protein